MVNLEQLNDLAAHIADGVPNGVLETGVALGELSVRAERDQLIQILSFLRRDPQCLFNTLVDICAVDFPQRSMRFDVVYHLLSMQMNQRVRVTISADEHGLVPSATSLWPAANWHEREVFDMYGVAFSGHPDLRRILTDYGFEGHPLRKDFPLTGHTEVRWDDLEKRVVYEPVKLPQEYRNFDFLSPWEGMNAVIPGDEKATTEAQDDG